MSKHNPNGAPEAPAIEELWLNYFNSYLFERSEEHTSELQSRI